MNTDDSTGNQPVQDGEFYGYGSWEEALEWLSEPGNLSQEGAQTLLAQTIGALYRALVERAESLEDWRRSELCWRSQRLLLGREQRDDDPGWLAVLEQQLVQCGALLERLAELSHPLLLPRRLLMVLGMHRSGTSAVAGHLCSHGFRAPHDTPPADYNNPTGYWESQSIVRLHTELLAEAQSSWDDPFLPGAEVVGAGSVAGRDHLAQALAAAFPGEADRSGVALLKEAPRLHQCRACGLGWILLPKTKMMG